MFDTHVTVVGNVLTAPEWRRTPKTNSLVTHFKVASTARRLDRENGRWVDGNSLRVRVNCWRKLAEGVAASVMVGDPVVVVGRLYNRDWVDGDGNHRTFYELEAIAVGHDLARGRGRFARNKPTLSTSAVEDPESDMRVRGEPAEAVPVEDAPARFGDLFDEPDPGFYDLPIPPEPSHDELSAVRGSGFGPVADALRRAERGHKDDPEPSHYAELAGDRGPGGDADSPVDDRRGELGESDEPHPRKASA